MLNRTKCRACGQDGTWCSVYTSCPLNKGGAHKMERRCITVKGKQLKHQFVYDGPRDGRHCIFCGDKEGTNDNSRSSTN